MASLAAKLRRAALAAVLAVVLVALVAAATSLAASTGLSRQTAPGRVLLATSGTTTTTTPTTSSSPPRSASLANGGTAMLEQSGSSLSVSEVDTDGVPVGTFGSGGGVARLSAPAPTYRTLALLAESDGSLLLVGSGAASPTATAALLVEHLTPAGTLDRTYGNGGVATVAITQSCATCAVAALAADGSLLLTGSTGTAANATNPVGLRWVIARLAPAGVLVASFGSKGILTLPGSGRAGVGVVALPGGSVLAEASGIAFGNPVTLMTRLTATGVPDPAFASGKPVTLPFSSGSALALAADGSITVEGSDQNAPNYPLFAHYTAGGRLDSAYGSQGVLDYGSQLDVSELLPRSGGGVLAVGSAPANGGRSTPTLLELSAAGAALRAPQRLAPGFGGGDTSSSTGAAATVPSLDQTGFVLSQLLPRPDGTYLAVGTVTLRKPAGGNRATLTSRLALAALSSSLRTLASFGARAARLRISARLEAQRASTALSRAHVSVAVSLSAPGLALVSIRSGTTLIAQTLVAAFRSGAQLAQVPLARGAASFLKGRTHVPVTITVQGRDLLATTATARVSGTLP
jgi:hypothetical protein